MPRSAGFPACGFAELSSSAILSAKTNWGLESPQYPQTRMSALLWRPAPAKYSRWQALMPRSAGFPACGFAELSSSAILSAKTNWGLESPQYPQTRMSALRRQPMRAAPLPLLGLRAKPGVDRIHRRVATAPLHVLVVANKV